ncbi:unnamed protein product, partial [Symbiodinium necroappetens]
RDINAVADAACGEAVREALAALPPWDPGEADDLTREVSQYLQRKAEVLLTSSERPPWEEGEEPPPRKKLSASTKVNKRQPNQHRPAANGGPNKRERIRTMVATGAGGHDWVVTSENKNNLLEPPKLHSFLTTPPKADPAIAHVPQDSGPSKVLSAMAWDWEWEWDYHSHEWRWHWTWRPDDNSWGSGSTTPPLL